MRALFALVARFQSSDKALHFLGVGTLAFLLDYALAGRTVKRFQLGGLIIAIAITLEEISQIWIPTRHFDYGDIASNIAGICCAGWILKRWFARFAA